MTISSTTNRVSYTGNGVTTAFSVPPQMPFHAQADLVVIQTVITTGVQTTKALTTDYTISGTTDGQGHYPTGGTVTMLVAPPATVTLTIYRDPTLTQAVDLVENDPLPVEAAVESPLDRVTMIAQRNRDLISRSLRQPEGDTANIDTLPPKVNRASAVLAFDVDGDPIASGGSSSAATTTFTATLLDDTTEEALLTTLKMPALVIGSATYPADTTGAVECTSSFTAAIAALPSTGGDILVMAPGTYLVDQISMPDHPKDVTIRCGPGVIFQAKATNTPIFKGCTNIVATVGTARYNILGFPALKAHASGSTGPAMDLRKWSHSRLEVNFASNGSGKWTYGFLFDATDHCYDNSIEPGMRIINSTPCSSALIRVQANANKHYVGHVTAVATAMPMFASFADSASISDWTFDHPYCEGWTASNPAVFDFGAANGGIHVIRPYFEDVVKAFDETATSECFIYGGYFAASPGASQGTALGANYFRVNNSGGANVCNALDTTNGLQLFGGGTIKRYASNNSTFASETFDGITLSWNFPMKSTGGDITASAGRVAGTLGTSSTTAPAIVMPSVITTAVGNVGAGEDTLQLYSFPANSLSAAGKGVRVVAHGTQANNANAKTLKAYFGTVAVLSQALTVNVAADWSLVFEVVSTGASTQDYVGHLNYATAAGVYTTLPFHGTLTQTQTNALNIALTGTATTDNDIVQEYQRVEFFG